MSFGRLFLTSIASCLIVTASAQARSNGISCPLSEGGKPLSNTGLFYGPLSDMAESVPQLGGWYHLDAYLSDPSSYLTLKCSYLHSDVVVAIKIVGKIRQCLFLGPDPQITCR